MRKLTGQFAIGFVIDNNDPLKIGRVKVYATALHFTPFWSSPLLLPNGHFEVPEVGSRVLVYFLGESPDQSVYFGKIPADALENETTSTDIWFCPIKNVLPVVQNFDPDESNNQSRYHVLHSDEFLTNVIYSLQPSSTRKKLDVSTTNLQTYKETIGWYLSNRSSLLTFETTDKITRYELILHAPYKKASENPLQVKNYFKENITGSETYKTELFFADQLVQTQQVLQLYSAQGKIDLLQEVTSSNSKRNLILQLGTGQIEEVFIVSSSSSSYQLVLNHGQTSVTIVANNDGTITLQAQNIVLDCNSCTITGDLSVGGSFTAKCCSCPSC